jgi:hypothetical protein
MAGGGGKVKVRKQSKEAKPPSKRKNNRSVLPVAKPNPPDDPQPLAEARPLAVISESTEEQVNADFEEIRARVAADPNFRRIKKAEWLRWRKLANDKNFVWETYQLKFQLREFLENNPGQIREFFRPTFNVTPYNLGAVTRRISDLPDEKLRALFTRYAKYVLRYGVDLILARTPPYFRTRGLGFWGNKLEVAVRNGQLEPIGGIPPSEEEGARPLLPNRIKPGDVLVSGTTLSESLESSELPVPAGLQSLVKEGWAKYVRIEDKDDFSILRQITNFAYSPDQVTVIDYSSTFPHKFYLVGENVPLNKVWPKLRRVAADSQRQTGNGEQRGRSPKMRRLYAELNLIVRGKGSVEDRAQSLRRMEDREREEKGKPPKPQTAARVAAKQTYLSQLKKQLKE